MAIAPPPTIKTKPAMSAAFPSRFLIHKKMEKKETNVIVLPAMPCQPTRGSAQRGKKASYHQSTTAGRALVECVRRTERDNTAYAVAQYIHAHIHTTVYPLHWLCLVLCGAVWLAGPKSGRQRQCTLASMGRLPGCPVLSSPSVPPARCTKGLNPQRARPKRAWPPAALSGKHTHTAAAALQRDLR